MNDEFRKEVAQILFNRSTASGNCREKVAQEISDLAEEHRAAITAMDGQTATPAEAAKVLLDLLQTPSEIAPIPRDTIEHAWQETFRESGFVAVNGFLRAIAQEGEADE